MKVKKYKMKKVLALITACISIIAMSVSVLAYTGKGYSIEIPDTYSEIADAVFAKSSGDNVTITMSKDVYKGYLYTKDNLNKFGRQQEKLFENSIKGVMKQANDNYNLGLSDDAVESMANGIEFNGIDEKKITKVSINKYECFYFVYSADVMGQTMYCEQYLVGSAGDFYIFSHTSSDKNNFTTDETLDMFDSIEIDNYKAPVKGTSESPVSVWTWIWLIFVFPGALITWILRRRKKHNQSDPYSNPYFDNSDNIQ